SGREAPAKSKRRAGPGRASTAFSAGAPFRSTSGPWSSTSGRGDQLLEVKSVDRVQRGSVARGHCGGQFLRYGAHGVGEVLRLPVGVERDRALRAEEVEACDPGVDWRRDRPARLADRAALLGAGELDPTGGVAGAVDVGDRSDGRFEQVEHMRTEIEEGAVPDPPRGSEVGARDRTTPDPRGPGSVHGEAGAIGEEGPHRRPV